MPVPGHAHTSNRFSFVNRNTVRFIDTFKKLLLDIAYNFQLIVLLVTNRKHINFVWCTAINCCGQGLRENTRNLMFFIRFILHIIVPGKPDLLVEQPEDAVVVSWILKEKNGLINYYHVTYIREDDSSDKKSRTTQETSIQFQNLMAGKTYEFQVGTI